MGNIEESWKTLDFTKAGITVPIYLNDFKNTGHTQQKISQ